MSAELYPVRRTWLNDVVNSLSSEEWRELQAILNRRSFQLDIIGNLPVELVALVFSYIDISNAVGCLYVSKRWQDLILQPIVQETLLSQWYNPSDLPLLEARDLSQEELFQLKIDHAARFKKAAPYRTCTRTWRNDNAERFIGQNSQLTQSHYSYGLLAFTMADPKRQPSLRRDDILQIHDLRSGQARTIKTPARELILAITTTRNLIGYITFSGTCYAETRNTNMKSWISLPSAAIDAFSGRDSHLCVLVAWTILVWDTESHSVKSFDIPSIIQTPSLPRAELDRETISDEQIHLSPDKSSVVYFALSSLSLSQGHSSTNPWDILYAFHFSLSGELISKDAIETRGRWLLDHPKSTYCALGARSCGRDGLLAVCFTNVPIEPDDIDTTGPSLSIIVYDEINGKLLEYKTTGILDSSKVAVWKGICISAGETHLTFINEEGQQYEIKRTTLIGGSSNQAMWLDQVFVDDTAVVTFSSTERRSGNRWEFNALLFDKDAREDAQEVVQA